MANFTDSSVLPQLTSFKEYVSQNDVSAMTSVGMQKQARYDEGVQRIQQQIDRVAGIDIIKPQHQQYLNTKLGELNNKLKFVAAGDFSNYQLTNSVGGMVSSIANDKVIQNAAYSTQVIKKQQNEIETAKKEGKSSPENEAYWNTNLNNWLENKDLSTPYTGQYFEYIDVDSKLRELAKELPEIENVQDLPLQRDNSGNILYFDEKGNQTTSDKGSPRYTGAMERLTTKGKSAQRILDNFMSSLSEADKNQLNITAWYNTQNQTRESLIRNISTNLQNEKNRISDEISDIKAELVLNTNLSSNQKTRLEAMLGNYNTLISSGSLDKQAESQIQEIMYAPDIEEYKKQAYIQGYLGNLANSLSYESRKSTLESNPWAQYDLQVKKYNLDVEEKNERSRQFWEKFRQDERHFMAKEARENAKLFSSTLPESGTDTELSTEGEVYTIDNEYKTLNDLNSQLLTKMNDIISITDTDQFKLDERDYTSLSVDEAQQQKIKDFNKLVDEFRLNPPANLDDNVKRALLIEYESLLKQQRRLSSNIAAINEKTSAQRKAIDDALNKESNIIVDGIEYTPREYVNLRRDILNKTQRISAGTGAAPTAVINSKDLEQYKGTKLEPLADIIARDIQNKKLTPAERSLIGDINSTYSRHMESLRPILEDISRIEQEEIRKYNPKAFGMAYSLSRDNDVDKDIINNIVTEFTRRTNAGLGTDLNRKENFDPSTVASWRSKPESEKALSYSIIRKGDGSGVLKISKGNETQTINMNADDFSKLSKKYAYEHPAENLMKIVNSSYNKTSNTSGKRDRLGAITAGFNASDFNTLISGTPMESIVKFDIEGRNNNTGQSDTDLFQIRMYVYDDKTRTWKDDILNKEGFVKIGGVYEILSQVGTQKVLDVKNKY